MPTTRRPKHRIAVAAIGSGSAFIALFAWTAAVIYYIDTTWQPNMGFWAVILICLSVISSAPLCFAVFRLSTLSSHRVMIVPYLVSLLLLLAILSSSILLIEWARSLELSLLLSYASLMAMILTPPLLLGFTASGIAGWLDTLLTHNRG